MAEQTEGKCPVMHGAMTTNSSTGTSTKDWWPNQLNLNILHQHDKNLILWMKGLITEKNSKKLITKH